MTAADLILQLMSDYQSRTTSQIAKAISLPVAQVHPPLSTFAANGTFLRVKSFKPGRNSNPEFRYKLNS